MVKEYNLYDYLQSLIEPLMMLKNNLKFIRIDIGRLLNACISVASNSFKTCFLKFKIRKLLLDFENDLRKQRKSFTLVFNAESNPVQYKLVKELLCLENASKNLADIIGGIVVHPI